MWVTVFDSFSYFKWDDSDRHLHRFHTDNGSYLWFVNLVLTVPCFFNVLNKRLCCYDYKNITVLQNIYYSDVSYNTCVRNSEVNFHQQYLQRKSSNDNSLLKRRKLIVFDFSSFIEKIKAKTTSVVFFFRKRIFFQKKI